MTRWKSIRAYEDIYKAQAKIAMGGLGAKFTKADRLLTKNDDKLFAEIQDACEQNRVDFKKTKRAALSNVRSKYYGLFWRAAKQQDVENCNRYAKALLRLRVVPQGFKQSLRLRLDELPKEAKDTGIKVFRETAVGVRNE